MREGEGEAWVGFLIVVRQFDERSMRSDEPISA